VLLPYLDGERTPDRPKASGVLAGLRSDVSRAQLARAAVEGVVCGLLDGLDALGAAGVDTGSELIAVGGGARSEALVQALASLSGRPVVVADGDEHVAIGAAVQAAALASGRSIAEVQAAWSLGHGRVVEPSDSVDRETVRGRYAARRDAEG
jgi:xylulokinase